MVLGREKGTPLGSDVTRGTGAGPYHPRTGPRPLPRFDRDLHLAYAPLGGAAPLLHPNKPRHARHGQLRADFILGRWGAWVIRGQKIAPRAVPECLSSHKHGLHAVQRHVRALLRPPVHFLIRRRRRRGAKLLLGPLGCLRRSARPLLHLLPEAPRLSPLLWP